MLISEFNNTDIFANNNNFMNNKSDTQDNQSLFIMIPLLIIFGIIILSLCYIHIQQIKWACEKSVINNGIIIHL